MKKQELRAYVVSADLDSDARNIDFNKFMDLAEKAGTVWSFNEFSFQNALNDDDVDVSGSFIRFGIVTSKGIVEYYS